MLYNYGKIGNGLIVVEFATESEGREWADNNGYNVVEVLNCTHSSLSCVLWMRKKSID